MEWYSKYLQVYEKPFAEAPQAVIEEVRRNLAGLQSNEPLVTVSLIGYNEEKHLLACLWSLSEMKCKYPVEIIGVDNESKDRTAEIYEACGVPYFTETQHSCGFARLCGLNHARGKYHINIDSDTMYPAKYVETMVDALEKPGVVAVSSLWSYIPDKDHSWMGLKIYEAARDLHYGCSLSSVRSLVCADWYLLTGRNVRGKRESARILSAVKTDIWLCSSSNSERLHLYGKDVRVPSPDMGRWEPTELCSIVSRCVLSAD